ncbi:Protein tyrosine kinase [Carpediemonas membranifera]|uniref:Protein tyrosine kinase n=1 Tax=Carpediemonas membranifera TaxID=201153 RepID=A0A8J6BUZ0_9EUKA|nr:Protein tyrosine kinase [Carpediemonas membranifera]|eukprot:KAG9390876.1 Protein tyrosine kinase [Carpediemonas membranifera]
MGLDNPPREFSMSLTQPDVTILLRQHNLVSDKPNSEVDALLAVWNATVASEGECIHTLSGHTQTVTSVAVLSDSTMVTGSTDGTARLWDTAGECKMVLSCNAPVNCLSVSPDGEVIASAGADHAIKLWDSETGKRIKTLKGHTDDVTSIAFTSDSESLISGSWDQTAKVWWELWDCEQTITTMKGHTDTIECVAVSPDGNIVVSGSRDHTVKVWNVSEDKLERTLDGQSGFITSLAFSADGRLLASGSSASSIRIWDTRTWQCNDSIEEHSGSIHSLAFGPNSTTLAFVAGTNTIKLCNIGGGWHFKTLAGHTDVVRNISFSPDGSTLLSGSTDMTAKLWFLKKSPRVTAELDKVCSRTAADADICLPSDDSPVFLADLTRILIHILATGMPDFFEMKLTHPACTVTLGPGGFTSTRSHADVDKLLAQTNRWPAVQAMVSVNQINDALYIEADLALVESLLAAGPHDGQHEEWLLEMKTDLDRLWPVQALPRDPMPALRDRVKEALQRSDLLHEHIKQGNSFQLTSKTLLRSGKFGPVVLNCLDQQGRSPLYSAFVHDQPQIFALLLKAGCLIDDAFPDGHPLLAVVTKPAMLDAMLATKVDVNVVSRNTTALVAAIQGAQWDSAMKLLFHHADPLLPPIGANALQATQMSEDPLMAGVIRAGINSILARRLRNAIKKGDTSMVKRLLTLGVSANVVEGRKPLLFAAVKGGNFEIVSLLLKHGADRSATHKGKTAAEAIKHDGHIQYLLIQNQETPTAHLKSDKNDDITTPVDSISFTKTDRIGEGDTATVYRGSYSGGECAVKVVALSNLNAVQAARLQNEIFVHKQLRHFNIVALYALEQGDKEIKIALELASELLSALLLSKAGLSWDTRLKFAREIATAMAYIASEGYEHRDLKAANILIVNNSAKVADFGLAASIDDKVKDIEGSWPWMAPERFEGIGGEKADVYAYGITLWEIAARDIPYRHEHLDLDAIRVHVRSGYRPAVPVGTPTAIGKLICRCLALDPHDRPTFAEVVESLPDSLSPDSPMYAESSVRNVEVGTFAGASIPWTTITNDKRAAMLTATYRRNEPESVQPLH